MSKTKITITKGDITKISSHAIVNAANRTLLGGGGVDGAIHRAAGPELLEECKKLGGCETGEAKITKGYRLQAKYVIHTAGPVWRGGASREDELLSLCYRNSLELAKKHNMETIAFPSISTGVYHFPIERSCPIVLNTTKKFLEENPGIFKEIIFVLFSEDDFKVYENFYRNNYQ